MRPGMLVQSGIRGYPDRDSALKALRKLLPYSVVFFRADFTTSSDLKDLVHAVNHLYRVEEGVEPPVIAVDQEGGNVVRIPWIDYSPSNYFLGNYDNPEFTRYVGNLTGHQLYDSGIRWNLAPVLDMLNSYNQVILERSYSEDVEKVASHGSAYVRGLQEAGVSATAKHFPGHGGVLEDSHLVLPRDTRNREAIMNEAYPFSKAIEAGAKTVMLSHVLYESLDSDLPASLSPIVQKMLREEFHFNGIMLTDAVDMKALANNYSRKEIVEHSVGQHADLVEAGDLDLGIELAEYVKNLDTAKFKEKYQRLRAIPLNKEIKFMPPAELLKSVAVSNNSIRRNVRIDPRKHFYLVFLDTHPESKVSELKSPAQSVKENLEKLNLDFESVSLEELEQKKVKNFQAIFIGRNEHVKGRIHKVNEICRNGTAVFISTSISKDLGAIASGMGYIAAYSSKEENLMGSIYRALGFF